MSGKLESSVLRAGDHGQKPGRSLYLDPCAIRLGSDGAEDFYWPLSRSEMEQFRDRVQYGMLDVIRSGLAAGGPDWTIARILFVDVILDVLRIFQAVAVTRRAARDGRRIEIPDTHGLYKALKTGEPPSPRKMAWLLSGQAPPPFWRLALRTVRDLIPRGPYTRKRVKHALPTETPVAVSVSSFQEQHAEKMRRTTGRRIILCSLWEWFVADDRDLAAIQKAEPIDMSIVNALLDIVEQAFKAHGEKLPPAMRSFLVDWMVQVSRSVRFFHDRLLQNPDRLPSTLWYGSTNHLWTRMLRSATQAHGGVCVGHDHGRGIALCPNIGEHAAVLDLCDEYVSFSPFISDRYEALDKAHPEALIHPGSVRFAADPQLSEPDWKFPPEADGEPVSGQTLMYVAPLWLGEIINLNCLPTDVVYTDWQARLLKRVHEWGHRIRYKAHPEGASGMPDVFATAFGAETVTGYIEQQHTKADIYLIDFLSSSFRTIVFTRKPIVFVDFGLGALSSETREILSKRCAIVDGWFDENNRAQVDWDALRDALRIARERTRDTSCARTIYGLCDD